MRQGSVTHENGFANRFEVRPEFLFKTTIKEAYDAPVREWEVNGLLAARVEDVFSGRDETFLVLGRPNTALVTPRADNTGFQKFSAYSLWRKPSAIENVTRRTGSYVQSGIWIRFLNLPEDAKAKLREGMEKFQGRKFRTCVVGNLKVLGYAGFSSGKRKLSSIAMPHTLMRELFTHGLFYEGFPVKFEVIRTTRLLIGDYWTTVVCAEIFTPWRHYVKTPLGAPVDFALKFPLRLLLGKQKKLPITAYQVAPALPSKVSYKGDIRLRATVAPAPSQVLKQIWGPHAFFEILVDRVNIDDYFTEALRPFPQKHPSLTTRLKKHVLFSPLSLKIIRKLMGASEHVDIGVYNEREVYDRLRTHSPLLPNKYNIVVVREPPTAFGKNPTTRIILSRVSVRSKIVDWVLSKHVLMSGYLWIPKTDEKPDPTTPYLVWAGELWKAPEGVLVESGNSGTYQPKQHQDQAMLALTQAILPHLTVEMEAVQR